MKAILITILFLLTVTLLFSQETCVSKVVIEGDTVIVLNPEKVGLINKTFAERDFYKEYCDTLSILVDFQRAATERQININRELNKRNIELLDLYLGEQRLNDAYIKTIDYYRRSLDNEKKRTLKFAIGGTVVGISIGTIAVLLLTN